MGSQSCKSELSGKGKTSVVPAKASRASPLPEQLATTMATLPDSSLTDVVTAIKNDPNAFKALQKIARQLGLQRTKSRDMTNICSRCQQSLVQEQLAHTTTEPEMQLATNKQRRGSGRLHKESTLERRVSFSTKEVKKRQSTAIDENAMLKIKMSNKLLKRLKAVRKAKDAKALKKCTPFKNLDHELLDHIVDKMVHETVKAGHVLCEAGDVADKMWMVISGKCNVTTDGVLMAVIHELEIVGESAIFDDTKRRTATVTATVPCEILSLDKGTMKQLQDSGDLVDDTMHELHKIAEERGGLLTENQKSLLKDIITEKRDKFSKNNYYGMLHPSRRFVGEAIPLITGNRESAAGSLAAHMNQEEARLRQMMSQQGTGGVAAIRKELERHPNYKDKSLPWEESVGSVNDQHDVKSVDFQQGSIEDWLHYILDKPASKYTFSNGIRDEDKVGMTFEDFCKHDKAKCLKPPHVLALRLYTTPVFKYFNDPLRKVGENGTCDHPMPVTVQYLADGLKLLRENAANELKDATAAAGSKEITTLWRAFKGVQVPKKFIEDGGTELAPMSTSTELEVAAHYCTENGQPGASALLMMLNFEKNDFMNYGAGLKWLSAFPGEQERLFPPLTYLKPLGKAEKIKILDINFTVVEVEPKIN